MKSSSIDSGFDSAVRNLLVTKADIYICSDCVFEMKILVATVQLDILGKEKQSMVLILCPFLYLNFIPETQAIQKSWSVDMFVEMQHYLTM